ncbi:hypothetical protein PVAND_002216 [Polypedilum vanderplanki]|uniref:C2H2-type domain-containing protein n=1 Tax=Polypedilum vanderplanki TaxID=319348 RepID=A0A9J6BQL0_POLVA|nr:hypothetical protein PVAND_002216 [Polypedilum vanderplanki]
MEFIAPNYTTLPSNNELKQLLELYNEVYGRVKRKVGLVGKSKLETRYSGLQIYQKLTSKNIFCYSSNYEIAKTIEDAMKELLFELGICVNSKWDHSYGGDGKNEEEWIIYLVEMNEDLRLCPLKNCGKVLIAEAIEEHIDSHDYMRNLKRWKIIQREKGSNALETLNTEPLPYHHDTYKSNTCKYCNMEWPQDMPMNQLQYHLSICPENPLPFFKCPKCGERLDRKRALDNHLKKHTKSEEQFNRELEFICQFCGKSFNKKWNRDAHEKICKKNPAIGEREIFHCSVCNRPYKDKYKCRDHEKTCTNTSPKRKKVPTLVNW